MNTTTKYDVSRDFLLEVETAKCQLSFGIDNLAYLIEAIEDVFHDSPGKNSFYGAMWCAFNQIRSSYDSMGELVESEYDRLRGAAHA